MQFIDDLKQLVAEGKVSQERIDDAVRRILRIKLQTRLFEHPFTDAALTDQIGSKEHRAVARQCVQASLVLLKNENHALPLSKQIKHLHVVGRGADDIGLQCGGWTIDWQGKPGLVTHGGTTILQAIRDVVGSGGQVTYSAGTSTDDDGKNAAAADAIVVVVGETPYAEGKGDRADLKLSDADMKAISAAKAAGKPVITVLLSGRPMILGDALDSSDAFIAAWLPGTEGTGVADVLFGDYKPTGKLPQAWPKSMDQLPLSTDAASKDAQFPFGFGLSY